MDRKWIIGLGGRAGLLLTLLCSVALTASGQSDFIQWNYLKAPNAEADDLFGDDVAISGNTLVISAWSEDGDINSTMGSTNNDGFETGAVYVYVRDGARWTQQAYLKPSNLDDNDLFGFSVDISGDTIVVGAVGEEGDASSTAAMPNNNDFSAGAAYVFVRNGTTWTQQAYLKASNAEENDVFGCPVAIDGDTIVVGASGEDGSAFSTAAAPNNAVDSAGAAYVFVRDGTTWTQQGYLKASNAGMDDLFGTSVDVSGDTIVVGAIFEDGDSSSIMGAYNNNVADSGAAYVYERSGSNWSQTAYLKAADPKTLDGFGWEVDIDGNTLVSTAFGEGGPRPENFILGEGAAYVFQCLGSTWTQEAKLKAGNPDGNIFDNDGFLVIGGDGLGGNVGLDGTNIILSSGGESGDANSTAASPNNNASAAGAAYYFALGPGPITDIALNPTSVALKVLVPEASTVAAEYSPDLSSGSWIDIGDFVDPDNDGVGTFTDTNPMRRAAEAGYYRGKLRP